MMQQASQVIILILFLISLPILFSFEQPTPEICDNALDDDHDGLIDLQDDDCYCEPLDQPSLLPNPSFEEQDCCPMGPSMLYCAEGWMNVTKGNPDYYHSCGYPGTNYALPQPIPDGNGFVGLIDGINAGRSTKEYLGACLLEPLVPDTAYRFEFYTGFLDRDRSPDIEMTLFGTEDCENLLSGPIDNSSDCPANNSAWVRLGSVLLSGQNQWVKGQFKVQSRYEIAAIAIGPDCNPRTTTGTAPYHFLDQVILKKESDFDLEIIAQGQECTDDLVFEIRQQQGYEYQWYKNGVAIQQATANRLVNPPGRGNYQVRVKNEEGCKISSIYRYDPPVKTAHASYAICAGESLLFNSKVLTEAGIYRDTLKTANACDSLVRLELVVNQPIETEVSAVIFPDEAFQVGTNSIRLPGEYTYTLAAASGCDSTIYLDLKYYSVYVPNAFSPNGDQVNDVFTVLGTTDLAEILTMQVYDRWGVRMYQGQNLSPDEGWDGKANGKPATIGVYVYSVELLMTNQRKRTFQGVVTLVR